MKIQLRWQLMVALGLVLLTIFLLYIHFLVFGDPDQTFAFLGTKIVFIPLQVLFITLVVQQLLVRHERMVIFRKMNMLVGTFFSEIGHDLLEQLNSAHQLTAEEKRLYKIDKQWGNQDFDRAIKSMEKIDLKLQVSSDVLQKLHNYLHPKRQFLLMLLGNPNLLEHEPFSDLLWAVFHLLEELSRRGEFHNLPRSDLEHLAGDAQRVYNRLVVEWIRYMKNLKQDYPYLFSLEMRINPFDEDRSVVVAE